MSARNAPSSKATRRATRTERKRLFAESYAAWSFFTAWVAMLNGHRLAPNRAHRRRTLTHGRQVMR